MVEECPTVLSASPIVFASGQVVAGNQNWSPDRIFGVNANYLTVSNSQMAAGDFFTPADVRGAAKVCVIGKTVAKNLFQNSNCVGATIRIKSIPFTVIGVLEAERGESLRPGSGRRRAGPLHHHHQAHLRYARSTTCIASTLWPIRPIRCKRWKTKSSR